MERPSRSRCFPFVSLAVGAAGDIHSLEVSLHIRPVVRVMQGTVRFFETEMSQHVMCKLEQGFSYTASCRYNKSFSNEHEVFFFLDDGHASCCTAQLLAPGVSIISADDHSM